jgi:chromosome segregation ATPase
LEETTRKKEIELINLKSRLDEINRQINSIKSEPYFCDYTENEDSYNNYINKNRFNSDSVESSINSLRSKIYDFKQKDEYLQNEVSKINATIKSNEELYKKYVKNKIDIVFYN